MPYPTGEDGTIGMDIGANGIAIGSTCPAELLPASVAWVNFFTQDPRAAQIYQSDNGVVAVDALAEAQANDPDTAPGQVRLHRALPRSRRRARSRSPGRPAATQAVTDTLDRAYDAVAFEQLTRRARRPTSSSPSCRSRSPTPPAEARARRIAEARRPSAPPFSSRPRECRATVEAGSGRSDDHRSHRDGAGCPAGPRRRATIPAGRKRLGASRRRRTAPPTSSSSPGSSASSASR